MQIEAIVANYARIYRQTFPFKQPLVLLPVPKLPEPEAPPPPPIIPPSIERRQTFSASRPRRRSPSQDVIDTIIFWHSVELDEDGFAAPKRRPFTFEDLASYRRFAHLNHARQDAVYELKTKMPKLSYAHISRRFLGCRDHTTLIHLYRQKRTRVILGHE